MILDPVYDMAVQVAAEPSTNEKIELLKGFLEDPDFRKCMWACYSEHLTFHINTFPKFETLKPIPSSLLDKDDTIYSVLKHLSEKSGADDNDKRRLFRVAKKSKKTWQVVQWICKGDFKCGVSAITINKARKDLIKITPYQRCSTSKEKDNITYEPHAIAQCKANGAFAYLLINDELKMRFVTRSGSVIQQLHLLKRKILDQPKKLEYGSPYGIRSKKDQFKNRVYIGELRVFNPDGKTIMGRKEGNGIITSCIYGTAPKEVLDRIFYTVWNTITLDEYNARKGNDVYQTTFFHTHQFVDTVRNDKVVRMIEFQYVKSWDEALIFYRKMRKQGEEGAVVKDLKGVWKHNTSTLDIKLKGVVECDLKIVGWVKGKPDGKYKDVMGALLLESADGLLRCKCGSGFTDEERLLNWDNHKSKIVTVEAESVIQNKTDSKKFSLYTPTFVEIRVDKKQANTLEEILEIERESKSNTRRKG